MARDALRRGGREVLPGAPPGWPDGLALGAELAVGDPRRPRGFGVYVSERGEAAKEIFRDVDLVQFSGTRRAHRGASTSPACRRTGRSCASRRRTTATASASGWSPSIPDRRRRGRARGSAGFALWAFAWSRVQGDRRLLFGHELAGPAPARGLDPTRASASTSRSTCPATSPRSTGGPTPDRCSFATASGAGTGSAVRPRPRDDDGDPDHPAGGSGARVRPDGRVWMRVSSADRAPRLLDDAGEEVPLPAAPGGLRTGRPYREWLFRNAAGDLVHGWLAMPPGDRRSRSASRSTADPTGCAWTPGSPTCSRSSRRGFAAMVNYRGSIGYRTDVARPHRREHGAPEVEDVVSSLDDLLARGSPTRSGS